MHKRRAVGAGARANAKISIESRGDLARVGVADVEGDDSRAPKARVPAVHHDPGNAPQPALETLDKPRHLGSDRSRRFLRHVFHANGKPRQAVRVLRPRLKRLWHEWRLALVEAVHARPALEKRHHLKPFANDEASCPLRAVEAFVPGEAKHVHPKRRHINRHRARRLRRIQNEQRARVVSHRRHARNVVHIARHVRRVRGDDQVRAPLKRALVGFPIKRSIRENADNLHLVPAHVASAEERPQHRVVRRSRGNSARPIRQKTRKGDVERHCGVHGKRYAGSVRRTEQPRHSRARLEYGHACRERRRVRPAPRTPERADRVRHCTSHTVGFLERRRRIVEVNHVSAFREICPQASSACRRRRVLV